MKSSRDTVWVVFAIWPWSTETYYPNGAAQKAIGRCGVRYLKGRGLPEPCGRRPSRSSPSPGLSKVSESSALRQSPQTLNVNQRHRLPGPTPTYVETNMFNSPAGVGEGKDRAVSIFEKFCAALDVQVQPPPDHHPICGVTMRRDCVKQHRPALGLGAIMVTTGGKSNDRCRNTTVIQ